MPLVFPELRVGEPVSYGAITVFPLFSNSQSDLAYRLSEEALADQSAVVEEISESGSVPALLVDNRTAGLLLFLEGEQLIGAKQNRILNTSVLVGGHTKLRIPVSCVEQGRWRYKSRSFDASDVHSPSKLRRALKASVTRSARQKQGHVSDQGQVWQQVEEMQACYDVTSPTAAMADVFDAHQSALAEQRERLRYVEGAASAAVAVGGKIVAVDLFDKPTTCQKVWNRLLSGVLFDSLESREAGRPVPIGDVERTLKLAADLPWEQVDAVGEGVEYRAESQQGDHATALTFGGAILHANILLAG